MGLWQRVVVVVVCLVLAAAPAAAAEPHVVDGCGPEGVAADPTEGVTTPWTDICSAVFETLPGGSGLKVTAAFAGDIPDDRIGIYRAQWRVGDCTYRVTHETGTGEHEVGPVHIGDLGGDWLRVRCGAGVPTACYPDLPLSSCLSWADERHYGLANAVVSGDTVTWTLRFAGELAGLGASHRAGTRLTNLWVESATKAGVAATNPSFCYGTMCGAFGGDTASGSGYTIGE